MSVWGCVGGRVPHSLQRAATPGGQALGWAMVRPTVVWRGRDRGCGRRRLEWNRLMRSVNGNTRRLTRLSDWIQGGREREAFGLGGGGQAMATCDPYATAGTATATAGGGSRGTNEEVEGGDGAVGAGRLRRARRAGVVLQDGEEWEEEMEGVGAEADEVLSWNVGMSGLLFAARGVPSSGSEPAVQYLAGLVSASHPTFICLGELRGTLLELRWCAEWVEGLGGGYEAAVLTGPGGIGAAEAATSSGGATVRGGSWRAGGAALGGRQVDHPHGGVLLAHRKGACERRGGHEVLACDKGVAVMGAVFTMADGRAQGVASCYASPYVASGHVLLRCMRERRGVPYLYAGDFNLILSREHTTSETRRMSTADRSFARFVGLEGGEEGGVAAAAIELQMEPGGMTRMDTSHPHRPTANLDWLVAVGDAAGRWVDGRGVAAFDADGNLLSDHRVIYACARRNVQRRAADEAVERRAKLVREWGAAGKRVYCEAFERRREAVTVACGAGKYTALAAAMREGIGEAEGAENRRRGEGARKGGGGLAALLSRVRGAEGRLRAMQEAVRIWNREEKGVDGGGGEGGWEPWVAKAMHTGDQQRRLRLLERRVGTGGALRGLEGQLGAEVGRQRAVYRVSEGA